MARLLFHKPKFAVLDECTSAVTTQMESRYGVPVSCIVAIWSMNVAFFSLEGKRGEREHRYVENDLI